MTRSTFSPRGPAGPPTSRDADAGVRPVPRLRAVGSRTLAPSAAGPVTPPTATDAPGGLALFIFCVYAFVLIGRPQDYVAALLPLRLALVGTFLTLAVTVVKHRAGLVQSLHGKQARIYLFFFVVMCAGIPFSIYRRASFDFILLGYTSNLIFFFMFVTHVTTVARLRRVAWVLMVALLLFSLQGMTQGQFSQGRYVTGSQMFDSNDVAFVLVSLMPFAIGFLLGSSRTVTKLMSLAAILLSVLLTLYTGSRGGLLGLATTFVLFLALGMPAVTRFRKAIMLACVVVVAILSLDRINVDRYMTLGSLDNDYNLSDEFGRAQVWERGFRLFLRNPLTGVGVDSFGEAIGSMRARENLTPYWQTAHNSYIQVLTETGIFGAAAFGLLIVTSLATFNRWRRNRSPDAPDLSLFAGVLLIGFIAQLVTAFFLSQAYSVLITLFFALSASLQRMGSQTVETRRPRTHSG